MSLKYEPASEPLHISVKCLIPNPNPETQVARELVARGGESLLMAAALKASSCFTCLHSAARNGHLEVVEFLVEKGGVELVDKRSSTGATATHYAAENGHTEVCRESSLLTTYWSESTLSS